MSNKMEDSGTSKGLQTFAFEGKPEKFSAFQPIDIKPRNGINWILNGVNNSNYRSYKDAYDDSPTNSSIINDYVAYIYGEGLIDNTTKATLKQIISNEDALLLCQDLKIYGGCSMQVIWNEKTKTPIKIKHVPIYKLGVRYNQQDLKIEGYWFCYDWQNRFKYRPQFFPKFTGIYTPAAKVNNVEIPAQNLEILFVRLPTAEPFFPVPDYISGIPWAKCEGEMANSALNHFKNGIEDITVINYNQGRQESTDLARAEADKVRKQVGGTGNSGRIIVSFNDGIEEAVTVDRISPPELNNQNVFYSEEAQLKLQIAHGMPKVLFSGDQTPGGFSSKDDEYAMALKILYRKKINPMRDVLANGIKQVTDLINPEIVPWFKDFEEETQLENAE